MHSERCGQRQSFGTAREHLGTYTWHARKTRRCAEHGTCLESRAAFIQDEALSPSLFKLPVRRSVCSLEERPYAEGASCTLEARTRARRQNSDNPSLLREVLRK